MSTTRRKILTSSLGVMALPVISAGLSACGNSQASVPATSAAELQRQIQARLTEQLNDPSSATTLTAQLMDIGLSWRVPQIPATQINRLVAYGFGNRPNSASGNTANNGANQAALPDPGPVNEALADAVYQIYQLNPVKIYAQWEIARFLLSKYQLPVISIEPIIAADGSITYLSTDGVAAAVIQQEGSAAAMGKVGIVAHRDHAKRCINTSKLLGMDAYAVQEVALPLMYDPQSGQAWTRSRDLYLVHDIAAQFQMLRAILLASA
ncbi:hypothetical protein HZU77_010900 [Neisseriaceae bacterium TC5R-5]|nr:hypothetical protein [Neisseriaceae bacterium TC5R-5]